MSLGSATLSADADGTSAPDRDVAASGGAAEAGATRRGWRRHGRQGQEGRDGPSSVCRAGAEPQSSASREAPMSGADRRIRSAFPENSAQGSWMRSAPLAASFIDPMTHRPTPCPAPRPVNRNARPVRRSSNCVLWMCWNPSVRPTTMRRSWPVISRGVIPSSDKRATRPESFRRQDPDVAQRTPEASGDERALQVGVCEFRAPRRKSAAAVIVVNGQIRRVFGARPDVRRLLASSAARRAVEHRRRRPAIQQDLLGGRECGALGRGVELRITWQCVWSHRSNPSAPWRPRFVTV